MAEALTVASPPQKTVAATKSFSLVMGFLQASVDEQVAPRKLNPQTVPTVSLQVQKTVYDHGVR
jgi:hypothetical protein